MKVNFNFPVDQYSGHDGADVGLVYMKSSGLNIARRFVIPDSPNSGQQQLARAALIGSAQNFKLLTPTQRTGFATYAAIDRRRILGKDITLQDLAMYMRLDVIKWLSSGTHMTAAPTALPGVSASAINTVAYVTATSTLTFNIVHNWTAPFGKWLIRITPAMASAQRMARPSDYRLIKGFASASLITSSATPQSISVATPTFAWLNLDYMHIQVTPISSTWAKGTPFDSRQQITVT